MADSELDGKMAEQGSWNKSFPAACQAEDPRLARFPDRGRPWVHPTGKRPSVVCIVGLGPSGAQYRQALIPHEPGVPWDEVWAVNTGIRHVPYDLAFVMDDMREYGRAYPEYGEALRRTGGPIITSKCYPEYQRTAIAYPLRQVLATINPRMRRFHGNSIPYLLAYALLIGVRRVLLFGVDFDFGDGHQQERGQSLVSCWVGYLEGRGIIVDIVESSPLLETRARTSHLFQNFYGYIQQPILADFPDLDCPKLG